MLLALLLILVRFLARVTRAGRLVRVVHAEFLGLLDDLKHSQRHLDRLLDLKLEPFHVAHHLVDLFEDLLALLSILRRSRRRGSLQAVVAAGVVLAASLQETRDHSSTVDVEHLLLEGLEPIDLADDSLHRLTVFHPRLREEQQQGQAQVGSFLDLDDARAQADLNDLLNPLTADCKDIVTRDVLQGNGRRVQEVDSLEDAGEELLRVQTIDAALRLFPLIQHVVVKSDHALHEVQAFDSHSDTCCRVVGAVRPSRR